MSPGFVGWKSLPFGYNRFDRLHGALTQAGLIETKVGGFTSIRTGEFGQREISHIGYPSRVRATPLLLSQAAALGLSEASRWVEWPLTAEALQRVPEVTSETALSVKSPGHTSDNPTRYDVTLPLEQDAEAELLRKQVLDLNAYYAAQEIEGCLPPRLRRLFFGDLRCGGRFFALGEDSYITFSSGMRRERIRFNGERMAEADLSAAFLSIALVVAEEHVPLDPYSAGSLGLFPREVVKEWIVQTLQKGNVRGAWADGTSEDASSYDAKAIKRAFVETYPALKDLVAMLPQDLREMAWVYADKASDAIEHKRGGPLEQPQRKAKRGASERWVFGQWLTGWESQIMAETLRLLTDQSIPALPIHDSVMVPERLVEGAEWALKTASRTVLGRELNVAVKDKSDRYLT